jgi:hypothetical protein
MFDGFRQNSQTGSRSRLTVIVAEVTSPSGCIGVDSRNRGRVALPRSTRRSASPAPVSPR